MERLYMLKEVKSRLAVKNKPASFLSTRAKNKKHFARSAFCFGNEAHLRCMKNEAGLRPMKRAFGSRRTLCALRFMATKLPLHKSHKAFASCSQSECFIKSLDFPAILWYTESRKASSPPSARRRKMRNKHTHRIQRKSAEKRVFRRVFSFRRDLNRKNSKAAEADRVKFIHICMELP